jgi:hypothetical protein
MMDWQMIYITKLIGCENLAQARKTPSEVSQKIVDTFFQPPYTVPAGELHLKYFIQPDKY